MNEIFTLLGEVGAPIAGSIVMGFFIFLVIKQILQGIVDEIKTLASLPSLEVIRSKLLSLLISTQTNIACTLNATQSGLARLINTKYQEKGE